MGSCQCSRFCSDNADLKNANDIITSAQIELDTNKMIQVRNTSISEINIKIKTWQKESYSLFDYENQTHLKEQSLTISSCGFLIKNQDEIVWKEENSIQKEERDELLLHIGMEDNRFYILNNWISPKLPMKEHYDDEENKNEQTVLFHQEQNKVNQKSIQFLRNSILNLLNSSKITTMPISIASLTKIKQLLRLVSSAITRKSRSIHQFKNFQSRSMSLHTKFFDKASKVWLVVRSIQQIAQNQGVRLSEGDIIKMGRVKFRVREINIKQQKGNEALQHLNSQMSVQSQEGAQQCRVCLSTAVSTKNPLVNPCKCAGTMKYIHLLCMQTWLRSKLHQKQNDHCIIYMWRNLECELCKFNYPPIFKSDERVFDLVELSKPKEHPYVLLEITQKKYQDCAQQSLDEQGNEMKSNGVYIICFGAKKELRVGRAHETEVRINDISVSRHHASFKMIDSEVFLQDSKSKFGSLVLLKQKIPLAEELNGLEIQVGRTVLQFNSRKSTKKGQQEQQN